MHAFSNLTEISAVTISLEYSRLGDEHTKYMHFSQVAVLTADVGRAIYKRFFIASNLKQGITEQVLIFSHVMIE